MLIWKEINRYPFFYKYFLIKKEYPCTKEKYILVTNSTKYKTGQGGYDG